MAQPRTILDQLSSVIVATGNGLRPCNYRYPIDKQPQGGAHRRFALSLTGTRISRQLFGAGYAAVDLDLRVQVYYARLGGDAGAGDYKSINAAAGTDGMRIADAITLPINWLQATTDIREISLMAGGSWGKAQEGDRFVVYSLTAKCECNVDPWPLPQVFV